MKPWQTILVGLTAAYLPGAVLLTAAFAKAGSQLGLLETLRALNVPYFLAEPAELGVILVEAALGASLIFFPYQRQLSSCAVTLLSLFTVVLFVLLFDTKSPTCHCFGAWKLFESRRLELSFGILRNCLLIAGLIWGRGVSTAMRPMWAAIEDTSASSSP